MKKLIHLLSVGVVVTLQFSCNNVNIDSKSASSDKITIENQTVRIDYTDTGNGEITLLLVHGWCINKTYWSNQVDFFRDKYRVITVDLPGFGQSGKNRTVWTTEAFGRDIDTVISKLNLKNVILVGHSMAGDIVLQAAINAPDRVIGLVGVDNFKNLGHAQTKQDIEDYAEAIDQLKHHFKQVAFQYVNQSLFYKTTADSIRERVLNNVAKADTVIATACMEKGKFDEVKKLTAAKKRLYLINSDVTPTDTIGFRANRIPYQVFYIHATGHFPMIEKPKEFNSLLEQEIAKIKTGDCKD